jgi:ABC-type lipoprotein export system ATPase subunit
MDTSKTSVSEGEAGRLLQLGDISKSFAHPTRPRATTVLKDLSLTVDSGQSLAVTGPSGSGKSTLLNIIGGLDRPDSGVVRFQGRNLADLGDKELSRIRNREIGFVFQLHYLLPQCTVLENVLIPTIPRARAGGRSPQESRKRAEHLLDRVGLGGFQGHFPPQLSGGELQRVAVVRALINRPKLLLADEPTGSLDGESAARLGELLVKLNREEGTALIVVTHSPELARLLARTYRLSNGALEASE